jgi:hypothetical protein
MSRGSHLSNNITPLRRWSIIFMESPVVIVMNIGETLIPCTWMFRVVHAQDMHNHLIDDLYLGVESSGFSELGVQQ